jgi:uncharacterized repeat protein (TIGR01451 family)
MIKRIFVVFMLLSISSMSLLMMECDAQPDLSKVTLKVEGPRLIFLSRKGTYTITVINGSKQVFKNVKVECTIPESLQHISSDPRGRFTSLQSKDSTVIEWSVGDVEPQEQKKIKLILRSSERGVCELSTKLTDGFFKPDIKVELSATRKIKIIGVPAMHMTTYDTEDPVEVGSNTTFVIEIRNEGTSIVTNTVLVDLIDSKMKFIAAEGPVEHSVDGKKVKFEPIPLLEPGEKATYKITCTAIEKGASENTASLKYDQFSKELLDQEGTSIYK